MHVQIDLPLCDTQRLSACYILLLEMVLERKKKVQYNDVAIADVANIIKVFSDCYCRDRKEGERVVVKGKFDMCHVTPLPKILHCIHPVSTKCYTLKNVN